jgi:hypothetical protein
MIFGGSGGRFVKARLELAAIAASRLLIILRIYSIIQIIN